MKLDKLVRVTSKSLSAQLADVLITEIQRNLQAMQFQQQHQNRIQDHYRHLMVAHNHDSFDSYDSSAMLKAPPPGLEPESESRHRFGASSLSTWIENMSI